MDFILSKPILPQDLSKHPTSRFRMRVVRLKFSKKESISVEFPIKSKSLDLFDKIDMNGVSVPYVLALLQNRFKTNKILDYCGYYSDIWHGGELVIRFEKQVNLKYLNSLSIDLMADCIYKELPFFKENSLSSYATTVSLSRRNLSQIRSFLCLKMDAWCIKIIDKKSDI